MRESASPIREKPVSPVNVQQPKTREYTPDAKASVSPSQHSTPRIHENVKAVPAETTPSLTERSVREAVSPVKEKPVPPVNIPQPKMREYAPNADVPVHRPQHPDSRIHEGPQPVHQPQTNRSVRELETLVRKKSAGKAKPAEQRPLVQASSSAEPTAPATASTVPPAARTLPREKPPVSSLREIPAVLKTDTTQFALPEIKTKEYIRKKRQKQNFLKEEATGIENITADSETFSPVIRTRETVREQRKLHVSHSAEQEQPALPQIRTRQPQTASMPADIEPTKPEVPQPPLPDIKSKQKYIAAQQPTQVTPVQANLQQAARQTGMKAAHGEPKLCQPTLANETVTMPASRNVAPTKPARVQKQARPAFVKSRRSKQPRKRKSSPPPHLPQKPCPAKRRRLLPSRPQLSSAKDRCFGIQRSKLRKLQRKPERKSCGQSRQRQKSWPQRLVQAVRRQFPLSW